MKLLLLALVATTAFAQYPGLNLPPSGNNQQATVIQHMGPVKVAIEYSSPAVHGPDGKDRRGQIWGKLVPYGLTNLGFGNGKLNPWRAGANENTVLEISHDALIEGKPLRAGRYGLHVIAGADEWTLILSSNSKAWGSFFYEPGEDALRVALKPQKHEYREWLTYDFVTRKPTESTVELQWEDLAVGFTISVQNTNEFYLSSIRKGLQSVAGFGWQGYLAAINYCLQEKTNLEEALQWSEASISMPFVGQKNFATLSTKSQVLAALGRKEEARQSLLAAIEFPGTTSIQIHQVGRQLMAAGQNRMARARRPRKRTRRQWRQEDCSRTRQKGARTGPGRDQS